MQAAPSGPLTFAFSQLRAETIAWLWPGWLAAGTVALLDGDPGQGKSLLTLDLAARLSAGRPLPDGYLPPGPAPVIVLASEDSATRTVLPRLQAAGANLDLIHGLCDRSVAGGARAVTFPEDCALLARSIRESQARLVVVDPFFAFLSTTAYGLNDQLVRRALTPLAQIADETGAVVLLVRHLTKQHAGRRAWQRGIGAVAVIGAARTAFLAAAHPGQAEGHALACTKSNLADPPPTLAYRIVRDENSTALLAWDGTLALGPDELLTAVSREPGAALEEAVAFLHEVLAHGPVSRESVLRQARAVGIADRTLTRAKLTAHVASEQRREDKRNAWYWSLSDLDDSNRIMDRLYQEDAALRQQP